MPWLLLHLKDFHYVVLLQVADGARVRITNALSQRLLAVLNVQRENHGLLDVFLRRDLEGSHWESLYAFVVLRCHCLFALSAIICSIYICGHARRTCRAFGYKRWDVRFVVRNCKVIPFAIVPLIGEIDRESGAKCALWLLANTLPILDLREESSASRTSMYRAVQCTPYTRNRLSRHICHTTVSRF